MYKRQRVTFKVVDADTKEPIPMAIVKVDTKELTTGRDGKTDEITLDVGKSYDVTATAPFYERTGLTLYIPEPTTLEQLIQLKMKPPEEFAPEEKEEIDSIWEKTLAGLGIAWKNLSEPTKETFRRFIEGVDYVKEHWADILIDAIISGITWTALESVIGKLATRFPKVKKILPFLSSEKKAIPRLTPKDWARFVKENPTKAAEYFLRTSYDKRVRIIEELRKDPAAWELFRDAITSASKKAPEAAGGFLSTLAKIGMATLPIFAITEIPQLITMMKFARKQALQEAGMWPSDVAMKIGQLEDTIKDTTFTVKRLSLIHI